MTLKELIEKYEISHDEIDMDNATYNLRDIDIEDIDADEIREAIEDGIRETCEIVGYKNAFDFIIENDYNLTIVKDCLSEIHGDSVPISDIDIERFATIVNMQKNLEELPDLLGIIEEYIDDELGSIDDDV